MIPNLETLCRRTGLAQDALDRPVDDQLLDVISTDQDLEHQLECLATSINITGNEVYDIKESEPNANRCRALFIRWKQLYGSEATYAKLIEGFEDPSNGRRDLTETVLNYVAGTTHLQERTVGARNFRLSWRVCLMVLLSIVMIHTVTFFCAPLVVLYTMDYQKLLSFTIGTIHHSNYHVTKNVLIPDDIDTNDTAFSHYSSNVLLKRFGSESEPNEARCAEVYNDLPNILPNIFIGRSKDIEEIARKIQTARIVNVNGSPGFGKSSVVIHTGYVLVDNGVSVRYIDVEEQLPLFNKSSDDYKPHMPSYNASRRHKDKETTALLQKMSSVSHQYDRIKSGEAKASNYIEQLILWSEKVECFTVLILDNCDDIITTYHKDQFINLVLTLIRGSKNYIHVVFVTQAKVLLVDSFEQWTVQEMTTRDSVELLQRVAPGITSDDAETVSNYVERCPLALKVVGIMLHLYGSDTLTKKLKLQLQHNPIDVLDHADQRRLQFRFIMELALSRIDELLQSECDYSMSLFPGTFDWEAGRSILEVSHPKICLDIFVKYSLLEEYYHHNYVHRYRMHRLIKEFLKNKLTNLSKQRFKERFSEYFEHFLVQHIKGGLNVIDEYELSLETLNVHHYIGMLTSQKHELTPEQLAILSYGVSKDLISFRALEPYYKNFMNSLTEVCSILDSDAAFCGKFYSRIIEHMYSECKCENVSRYFKYLLNSPCPCTSPEMKGVFQCQTVYDINHTKIVWVHLSTPVQEYLSRVMLYNCYHDHMFAINFLIFIACLALSTILTIPRKYGYLITAFAIVSILHIAHLVQGEQQTITIIETFLKAICYKLLFLVLLCMSFIVVQSIKHIFVVVINLSHMFVVMISLSHMFVVMISLSHMFVVVISLSHMFVVMISLTVLYFIAFLLWRDTTYPLQGCDFLPLCQ